MWFLRQEVPRINLPVRVAHHLEVQVRSAAVSGAAYQTHGRRPLVASCPTGYTDLTEVRVQRLPAVAVIDDDHQPVPPVVPACVDDDAVVGRTDRIPGTAGNVDPRGRGTVGETGAVVVAR